MRDTIKQGTNRERRNHKKAIDAGMLLNLTLRQ
jgi:hypothetical protein